MNLGGGRDRLPVLVLYVIGIWLPLQYLPTRQYPILPESAVWLDEALVAGLALYAAVLALREPERGRLELNLPILAFLVVALISAARNRSHAIELALGLRALLQGVAVYYIIVLLRVPRRDLVRLARVTVALAVLQAPLACYQLATTYQLMSRDEIVGTMWRGASNSLAYFLVLVMLPLMGFWIREPSRRWPLAALAAMLVPFVFSSSRGAYYVAPLVAVACFWEPLRRHRHARTLIACQAIFAIALFGIYYALKPPSPGSEMAGELLPMRVVREQLDPKGGMGRLYYLEYLLDLFAREGWSTFLVGVGPARFSSTSGVYLSAPLLVDATRGAHSQVIPSQIVATLSEYGVFGLAAFGWAIMRGIGILRRAATRLEAPAWRGFAEGGVGAGLFFVFASPLENIWELQFCADYFWAAVAAVTLALRRDIA